MDCSRRRVACVACASDRNEWSEVWTIMTDVIFCVYNQTYDVWHLRCYLPRSAFLTVAKPYIVPIGVCLIAFNDIRRMTQGVSPMPDTRPRLIEPGGRMMPDTENNCSNRVGFGWIFVNRALKLKKTVPHPS